MKRSPLTRRTPLRARAPMKRTVLRRSSAMPRVRRPTRRRRPEAEEAAWQAAREAIYRRSGGRCEKCADDLNQTGMDAHHRKLRSRGGTDDLANLAALCPSCHRWVHDNPVAATGLGWMVLTVGNPRTIPIQHRTRLLIYLTTEGTYSTDPPRRTA